MQLHNMLQNNIINTLGIIPIILSIPLIIKGNVIADAKLLWDTDWEKELSIIPALKQEHRLNILG